MTAPVPLRRGFVALALVASVCLPGPAAAGPTDEAYAAAVRQLQQEGFAGVDRALAVFEDLVRREPTFLPAYLGVADAYVLKYEFAEAKERAWLEVAHRRLDAALAREPSLAAAHVKRAVVRFTLGVAEGALADLTRAMELAPTFLDARLLYLQHLLARGQRDEARRFAQASAPLFPGEPAALRYMGDVFFQAEAYAEAVDLYRVVLQRLPRAPYTKLLLGRAHQKLGQHAQALGPLRAALAEDPALSEAHFDLATSLAAMGQPREALDHLARHLAHAPDDPAALNNLALLLEQAGDLPRAREAWTRLVSAAKDATYRQRAEQHLQRLASAGSPGAAGAGDGRAAALRRAEAHGETQPPGGADAPAPDYSVADRFRKARQERLASESKAVEADAQAVLAERQAAAQEAQRRRAREQELQAQATKWQDELDKQATASAQAAQAWQREHSAGAYAKRFLGMVIQTSVGAFTGGLLGTLSTNLANQAVRTLFPDASTRPGPHHPLAAATSSAITGTATGVAQAATSAATSSLTGTGQTPAAGPRY